MLRQVDIGLAAGGTWEGVRVCVRALRVLCACVSRRVNEGGRSTTGNGMGWDGGWVTGMRRVGVGVVCYRRGSESWDYAIYVRIYIHPLGLWLST